VISATFSAPSERPLAEAASAKARREAEAAADDGGGSGRAAGRPPPAVGGAAAAEAAVSTISLQISGQRALPRAFQSLGSSATQRRRVDWVFF
jgi:hypothetical protein